MFQFLRSQTKTIIIILVSLIIPAFVLWGVSSAIVARKANAAGKMGGQTVTLTEYNHAFAATELNAYLTYGDQFKMLLPYLNLHDIAWERLALVKDAQAHNISVSDVELLDHIHALPYFQVNNVFSKERYASILTHIFHLTPEQFEEREKQALMILKRIAQIKNNVILTDAEFFNAYKVLKSKVKIAYVMFPSKPSAVSIEDTAPELQAYYNAHQESFRVGIAKSFAYVAIHPDTIATTEPSEAEVTAYYNAHKEEYILPTAPTAETTPAAAPAEPAYQSLDHVRPNIIEALKLTQQETAARKQASTIAEALLDNSDLSAIEKDLHITFKETPSLTAGESWTPLPSAEQLSQIAADLAAGESSDVIPAEDGFYVIKVLSEKPSFIPPFSDIVAKVKAAYQKDKSRELAQAAAHNGQAQWSKAMAEKKISAVDAARQLQLMVQTSEFFTQASPVGTLGYNAEVNEAGLHLNIGEVSQPIATAQGFVVVSPIERVSVSAEEFAKDDKKDELLKRVLEQKRSALYNSWLTDLKKHMNIQPNPKYFSPQAQAQGQMPNPDLE